MTDTRSQIGEALAGKLSPEQLNFLVDEVLAITKKKNTEITCRHCNRMSMVYVEVPDAKAVTSSLVDLLNQAWGRPTETSSVDEGIQFVRKVVYSGVEG